MRTLKIEADALGSFLEYVNQSKDEEAAVLVGNPDTLTVSSIIRVDHPDRSPVHVHVDGALVDADVRAAIAQQEGSIFLGYAHTHLGLEQLSGGDLKQIKVLLADSRTPNNLLMLLAIKVEAAPVKLRAWLFAKTGATEELFIDLTVLT